MRIEGSGQTGRTGRALVPAAAGATRAGPEDRPATSDPGRRSSGPDRASAATARPVEALAASELRGFARTRVFVPLLAQLIATRDDHPQTRARRRAEAAEATAAYAEGLKRVHRMPAGSMVARTYT